MKFLNVFIQSLSSFKDIAADVAGYLRAIVRHGWLSERTQEMIEVAQVILKRLKAKCFCKCGFVPVLNDQILFNRD